MDYNDLSSKFGKDDELGNLNYIDEKKVLSSLRMVKYGRVYNLSHVIFNGMADRLTHGPFFFEILLRPYDNDYYKIYDNKYGASLGRIEMCDHTGTHLDSLNHMAYNNKLFNNIDAYENTTNLGSKRLGIEKSIPIITKGIMIDVAGMHKKDKLEPGYAITREETEIFLKDHNIEIDNGDAVFFYTGLSREFNDPKNYDKYYDSSPGIGYDLAKFLSEKNVSVSGSDTPSSEVTPPEIKNTRLPVHQYLIAKCGIRLIDNIKLDELSRDRIYEFAFICLPLLIKGATASPVSPVAII
ncbi:cyclase family protein [Picrophilus oshimae]|uniref:Cyclase n=1 Tax=Picrophilus torridus (strain ATCC 700027 / DSM 9790 / JCM 10055 / NBRC 100828 / KAW 2/3) TaxID=1122961 RepID=Q6L2N3_PICTO|nr:cyclase family protein [Picrophilus oshimae]AAT42769.1 cyclase [Picrophilus oshimae DSM 9789]SMD31710.1 Kynurenine formamidase [Picrophilus oshimae DSM 9789]